ncbi:DNA excision repair protein (Rad5), putative [Talaromyces stipitatus ATCC 10500]|uniref:DNA excision repair protein (Rad5), putative n=1 Tax=Talaromyces stipitatus (strain ATCC 10500 / CBS 375.48 / QM 6759 / NRRL 1006) TaxID=441959 RepID=B8M1M5_TALSN|nr:DNA excision repair protein (Rad5), putative [Talaromyces stipitatus ATCC 10500]EED22112.1 DNA excision repair protein (Rad5), putative [Talaromyces stipitatus ATCC 10500]
MSDTAFYTYNGDDHDAERPAKKRRFFVEDENQASRNGHDVQNVSQQNASSQVDSPVNEGNDTTCETFQQVTESTAPCQQIQDANGFDAQLFTSIVGQDVPESIITKIRQAAGGNIERAINIFLDGSYERITTRPAPLPERQRGTLPTALEVQTDTTRKTTRNTSEWTPPEGAEVLQYMPSHRYIGAFGVAAWATRSGLNVLRHGDKVKIERTKMRTTKIGRKGRVIPNQKADVITRFTNIEGEEIGRLPQETAEWVSTLIDQKICDFEGYCVFAPDWMRVNDTVYLQLHCYLKSDAFVKNAFYNIDDNRTVQLFEQKESTEEKDLRIRQIALVRLFDEIGLLPTSTNETTAKHKKEGLLRAAEMAEQYDKNKDRPKEATDLEDSGPDEETAELEEDHLDTLYQKAQSFDFNTPEAQPAETFALDLRKYQKQALHWMLAKERDTKSNRGESMHPLWEEYKWPVKDADDKILPCVERQDAFYVNPYSGELSLDFPVQEQHCLGGILADEMGLGKTIEMMSLVHTNRETPAAPSSMDELHRQSMSATGIVAAPYTTLVVAPTSLLAQWESEAQKASAPGTMKTLIYYGSDRSTNLKTLCSRANGINAPNVIVTSYGVVLSEFRSFVTQGQHNPAAHIGLFSLEFFRVILDEAHLIKNRLSKSARACYELNAIHRWVLTGTPIVNRLEDLFSLVRFLKVEPWSNFSFWKTFITVPFESKDYVRALNVVQSVLEPLVLRRTKTMQTPEGEALVPLPPRTVTIEEVELSEDERAIYDLVYYRAKRTFNDNVEAGTLMKSYSTIFAQILRLRQTCCHPILTRNKAIVADEEDAALAADAVNEMKDDMDLQELIDRFTKSTESSSTAQSQDTASRFTTHALRQIQNDTSAECPICSEEPLIEPAVTGCWHSACKKCLENYIRHQTDKGELPRCFSCRAPVTRHDIFEVIRYQSPSSTPDEIDTSTPPTSSQPAPRISLRRIYPLSPSAHTSAKIHALITHLLKLPPNSKSVVFSQFTSFLDLIGPQLTKAGLTHLRLDGSMPQKARAEVLRQFNRTEIYEELESDEDAPKDGGASATHSKPPQPSPSILLISLRAGGVGLNLTAANNVFMMDPWWSFAVEAQAIDRVHRMGQLREVSVTRFVVKDSIEVRMLRVQERKMNIAGSLGLRVGGDGTEDDRKKNRIEELRLLFE